MLRPFAVVLLCIIFFCFLKSRGKKEQLLFNIIILAASVELFIEVGYFFRLGKFEFTYRRATEFILFLVSIYVILKSIIVNKKVLKYGVGLFITLILSLVLLLIFPSNALVANINNSWEEILTQQKSITHPEFSFFVVQQNFQMVIYITALFAIYKSFEKEDYFNLIKSFSKVIKFFFVLGTLELILKYAFRFEYYGNIIEYIFGLSESTISEARVRGFGIELTGLTKEASHYSYMLFMCIIILFSKYTINKSKHDIKWVIIGIVLILFCMSFSTVLFISAIITIYILFRLNLIQKKKNIKKQLLIILLVVFAIVILFSFNLGSLSSSSDDFFSRRISSLLEEKNVIFDGSWETENTALEWSNRVRLLSIFMTLKAFVARPLFGYGFGTITCHGATAMMLAGTGIFGIYFWTKINFYIGSIISPNLNKKYYNYSIVIFLIVNLFNSFALRPFHELYTFLFAISIGLLFNSPHQNENYLNYTML